MRKDSTRLAELQRLMILESQPERDYDNITKVLAESLEVPIAIVNMLDDDRDWFKACVGLPFGESPAATSFCEQFFRSPDDVVVVPDTTLDPRFSAHPLVQGDPYIRFYAAARLHVNGHTVGTLCAYDLRPREITAQQIAHMQVLAEAVIALLKQRPAS